METRAAREKVRQGRPAWFEMVGTLMSDAASRAAIPADLNVSVVERYTDGIELSDGMIQGIRFEIVNGQPSFRVGVGRDERAEITVEVTAAAARKLNALHSAHPAYFAARERYLSTGEMRVDGDLSRLSDWLEAVHDPIVERTI